MVQVDGPKSQVYIKFRDNNRLQDVLHLTEGQVDYRHTNGKISIVRLNTDLLGMRKIRIANLHPEVPNVVIRKVLSRYGDVKELQADTWSRQYRYSVANVIRLVTITLAKHISSHTMVAGKRVLVSYEGQSITCCGCNDTGHLHRACPMRRKTEEKAPATHATTWADRRNREGQGGRRRWGTAQRPKRASREEL